MKSLVSIFFVFIFTVTKCLSQDLTFQDLRFLIEHGIEDGDNYLAKHNFLYHKTDKSSDGSCEIMLWSYERNTSSNTAKAFISKYCFAPYAGTVLYQFSDRKTFDNIKTYCKGNSFKLVKTETDKSGNLCSTLESENYVMKFCSGLNPGTNKNSYTIRLSPNTSKLVPSIGNRILANQKCTLTGCLQRKLFYGPPNFGEDTLTDKKEYSFILKLHKPIQFLDSDFGSGEWIKISEIHVMSFENEALLSLFINKDVTVTCTLAAAHTGHHHAPAITWEFFNIKELKIEK